MCQGLALVKRAQHMQALSTSSDNSYNSSTRRLRLQATLQLELNSLALHSHQHLHNVQA
jgi:hypothetical protein